MSQFQNTIDLLGDETASARLVERQIEEYNDDVIRTLKEGAFGGSGSSSSNTKIKKVRLPNLTNIGKYAFSNCILLELVDAGKISKIESVVFSSSQNLATLILRSESVCSLSNAGIQGTPFASGGTGGTVYVPAALIESYQNETNWSTLYAAGTCNFVAIEGSEYE